MTVYKPSCSEFTNSTMFYKKEKLQHKTGSRLKVFPFSSSTKSTPTVNLESTIGYYLSMVTDRKPKEMTAEELSEALQEETNLDHDDLNDFQEVITLLFFYPDGKIRPLNLEFMMQNLCSQASDKKTAEYMASVLGRHEAVKDIILRAENAEKQDNNVLEQLAIDTMKKKYMEENSEGGYFPVVTGLQAPFEKDLEYVLQDANRIREDLTPMLELYFTSYTAQSLLHLRKFLQGERTKIYPLYFALEWEKTSQNRYCYRNGWENLLKPAAQYAFHHAITLEILNQTEPGSDKVDYITLADMIRENPQQDAQIAQKIDELTQTYRNAITDSESMKALDKEKGNGSSTEDSVRYLFKSIKLQFEDSSRNRASNAYIDKFTQYLRATFLKQRGRNGSVLSLSEEMLILLTRLAIKERKSLRLNKVFHEFENRGVFLDNQSKEIVIEYYEKLNLIEKKSDSGDAMYVKRIL